MTKEKMDDILRFMAQEEKCTPEEVRREIELVLEEAQSDAQPILRQRWQEIPHKGEKVTPEEFLDYVFWVMNRVL